MGQNATILKANFEDVQQISKKKSILINTLPNDMQDCLISGTISIKEEEKIMNSLLENNPDKVDIILYGMNSNDNSVLYKYQQLIKLGFTKVFIYSGGLFEWLCLQEIYGDDNFQTTKNELDILKYKPKSIETMKLICDQ